MTGLASGGGMDEDLVHGLRRAATAAAQLRVLTRRASERIADLLASVDPAVDTVEAAAIATAAHGMSELAERLELSAIRASAVAAEALARVEGPASVAQGLGDAETAVPANGDPARAVGG